MSGSPNGRADPPELRLDLPATHAAVRMARHMAREFAERRGLDEAEIENLILVMDELLSNAVDHGGGGSARHEEDLAEPVQMMLVLILRDGGWVLDVGDEGGGDPEKLDLLLHPPGLPDLEDERGRGFFLISGLCQSLSVRRREDGKGLVVTAVRLNGPRS